MTIDAIRFVQDERLYDRDPDDKAAELIASLTADDVDRLWSVIIQLKPQLAD